MLSYLGLGARRRAGRLFSPVAMVMFALLANLVVPALAQAAEPSAVCNTPTVGTVTVPGLSASTNSPSTSIAFGIVACDTWTLGLYPTPIGQNVGQVKEYGFGTLSGGRTNAGNYNQITGANGGTYELWWDSVFDASTNPSGNQMWIYMVSGPTSGTTDTLTTTFVASNNTCAEGNGGCAGDGNPLTDSVLTISLTGLPSSTRGTSTVLNTSVNPATAPQIETFTATVQATDNNAAVTEGTIQFTEDGATISGCGTVALTGSGTATCSLSLSAGGHAMAANYSGDANFSASGSGNLTETVNSAVQASQQHAVVALTQSVALAGITPIQGSGGTGTLTYSISSGLPSGLNFSTSTGVLSGTPNVTQASSSFTVTVTDGNSQQAQNSFQLVVNAPVVASTPSQFAMKNLTIGQAPTNFTPVTATGGTAPLSYSISPTTLPSGMTFSTTTGLLTAPTPSQAFAQTTYTVTVTDANGSQSSSFFQFAVVNGPITTLQHATVALTVGRPANIAPMTGTAAATLGTFTTNPALGDGLSINSTSGAITGTPTGTLASTPIIVTLTDVNSVSSSRQFSLVVNPAVTAPSPGAPITLTQNQPSVTIVTPVQFSGGTAPFSYAISSAVPAGMTFSTATGQITGSPTATLAATSFTVTATDANGSSASNSFSLTVDSAVGATLSIPSEILTQNQPATSFKPVTGSGGDAPLSYSILPALPDGLSLNTANGTISGAPIGTQPMASYAVTVSDVNLASATVEFFLTIKPEVTATTNIADKPLTQNQASTSFIPVQGANGTGALTYTISPGLPAGLSLTASGVGAGTISGSPTVTLSTVTFTVTVTDANNASKSSTFTLESNAPPTATQAIPSEILTQGNTVSFTPVTGASGTPSLSYSVSPSLPAGLTLDPSSGAISGAPTVTHAASSFTVTVTDLNNVTASNTFQLTVNSAVTATQAVPVEKLTLGRLAGFTPVTGGSGTGSLSYSISPPLPSGLSINAGTGAISGTPSVAQASTTFTVTVTDANSATASNTFSLTVNAAPTTNVAVTQAFLTKGFTVTPFTPVLGQNGTTPYSYSISPTLPAGLSFDSSSGAVGGTPSVTFAAANFTVTVTDANGATATGGFRLTVNGPVAATQVIASKGLTVETPVTPFTPVTGSGGTGTLSYSVSPTLPAGLAVNSSTGAINGLPTTTSAATSYTVTVTDQNGATSAASFSLAVNGAVTATTAVASTNLTQGHLTTPFTPVTGGGGTTPYTYSVSPSLPAGLTLSTSTGQLSGTPSVMAAATGYTVTVTDANGATKTADFSLMVNAAVTATQAVATTSLKVNQAATPFTPVTGGGGTGALVYSVSPSLPAGLSLASATGTISGTPTATLASTSFTVTVTDTNGATASAGFALSVTTTQSTLTVTSSLNPSNLGQTVTFTAVAGGSGAKPTGTVVFKDGATTLFTGTLAGAISSYTSSTLTAGLHTISVTYSGDGLFAGSSASVTQVVGGAPVTPGKTYPYSTTLTGFNGPGKALYDPTNDHLLIVDSGNQRVEVLNAQSLALIAVLGTTGVAGSDNAHLNDPTGVAFDGATDQIFVADSGNDRIQVYDATSFAYVETIGDSGSSAARLASVGNTSFNAPGGLYSDAATGRLYVADTGNQRVQIFDRASMAYVATLGTTGAAGSDTAHFNAPADVTVNNAVNEILVADSGNSRVQRFDATSFAYKGTIGGATLTVANSDYLATPSAVAYDPSSNLVLVADSTEERVEVFDALSYTYVQTIGTTGSAGAGNNQFSDPSGIAIDIAHERILIGDLKNNRVQVFAITPTVAFASVLPGSRSVELGHPATIFASMINAGTTALTGCAPALPVTAPAGLTLTYQTTNPATNALTGVQDTPATIAGNNGVQSFLVTFQGSQSFSAPGMALDFGCLGIGPAAVATGVDTVDLAMSTAPVADVIALAATASNDGIAKIPAGGASAFAVASSNVGATSQIVVSVDTGTASLPLTATLCQSNPSTGACLATPSNSVTLSDASGAAPTFSVFLQATGSIPFAPAASRVFVRFKDPSGGLHGSTSVAVETE